MANFLWKTVIYFLCSHYDFERVAHGAEAAWGLADTLWWRITYSPLICDPRIYYTIVLSRRTGLAGYGFISSKQLIPCPDPICMWNFILNIHRGHESVQCLKSKIKNTEAKKFVEGAFWLGADDQSPPGIVGSPVTKY